MALMCPIDLDVATLRNEIRMMYGRVAADPDGEFHFHRGPAYAASKLGYDENQLMQLPSTVTASFAGVGNRTQSLRLSGTQSSSTLDTEQAQICSSLPDGLVQTAVRSV